MSFLTVSGIHKKEGDTVVVNNISFTQQQFVKMAIVGETGSGKSTLLKIIAGMVTPDVGEVVFDEERIKKVPAEKLIPGHQGIAYLSQHFELRNNYRVEELLSYANVLNNDDAATMYELCRIEHLLQRRTDQLSGGEKQRIALARLLVSSPKLLLLDEPFSNLDMVHKKVLKTIIQDIGEQLKITCILVSHDPLDVLSWANEIIIMKDAQIVQQGIPAQMYCQPVNEYAGALLGKYNLISPARATAFYNLPGIEKNDKQLFIRPENMQLASTADNAIKATVYKILFFGAYYEIEVFLTNSSIIIHSMQCTVKKGDTVYVTVAAEKVWYI